jgi:hypothetical protein
MLTLPNPSREAIQKFQVELAKYEQMGLEPKHYFADGEYGRELFIKAQTFVVGKIHLHEHLVMLAIGEVTINTDKGMERIKGPKMWVSPAGAKRALFTHTDCVFWTVHLNPSNTQDIATLEAAIIEPEPSPFDGLPDLSNDIQRLYA